MTFALFLSLLVGLGAVHAQVATPAPTPIDTNFVRRGDATWTTTYAEINTTTTSAFSGSLSQIVLVSRLTKVTTIDVPLPGPGKYTVFEFLPVFVSAKDETAIRIIADGTTNLISPHDQRVARAEFRPLITLSILGRQISFVYNITTHPTLIDTLRILPLNFHPQVSITNNFQGTILNTLNPTFTATFTFTEPVVGFTANSVFIQGARLSSFAATSSTVYRATVQADSDSATTCVVRILANTVNDVGPNDVLGNLASTGDISIPVDTRRPSLSLSSSVASFSTQTSYPFGISLVAPEPVIGLRPIHLVVTGGTLAPFTISDGATVIPLGATPFNNSTIPFTITIRAGSFTDAAQNPNGELIFAIPTDTQRPKPELIAPSGSVLSATQFTVRVRFAEAVSTLVGSTILISGGATVLGVTRRDSANFDVLLRVPAQFESSVQVLVPENVVTDTNGNPNVNSTELTVRIDNKPPTQTLSPNLPVSPVFGVLVSSSTGDFNVTVSFSEPVTRFSTAGVSVTGGVKLAFFSLSSTTYAVLVRPNPNSIADLVVSLASGAAVDVAGNPSDATSLTMRVNTQVPRYVQVPDTCSFGFSACPTINLARPTLPVVIAFSKPVSNFGESDIVVTGLLDQSIQFEILTTDQVFRINLAPSPTATEVVVSVPATTCCAARCAPDANLCPVDIDGNLVPPTELRIPVDLLAPSATFTMNVGVCSGNTLNAAAPTSTVRIQFDTSVTINQVPLLQILPSNPAIAITATALTSNAITATVTALSTQATACFLVVPPNVAIDSGRNPSAELRFPFTVDTIPPSLELSVNYDQNFGTITRFHDLNLQLTVQASEAIQGFSESSLNVDGVVVETLSRSAQPNQFIAALDLASNETSFIRLVVPAGKITDQHCNSNTESNSISLAVDVRSPGLHVQVLLLDCPAIRILGFKNAIVTTVKEIGTPSISVIDVQEDQTQTKAAASQVRVTFAILLGDDQVVKKSSIANSLFRGASSGAIAAFLANEGVTASQVKIQFVIDEGGVSYTEPKRDNKTTLVVSLSASAAGLLLLVICFFMLFRVVLSRAAENQQHASNGDQANTTVGEGFQLAKFPELQSPYYDHEFTQFDNISMPGMSPVFEQPDVNGFPYDYSQTVPIRSGSAQPSSFDDTHGLDQTRLDDDIAHTLSMLEAGVSDLLREQQQRDPEADLEEVLKLLEDDVDEISQLVEDGNVEELKQRVQDVLKRRSARGGVSSNQMFRSPRNEAGPRTNATATTPRSPASGNARPSGAMFALQLTPRGSREPEKSPRTPNRASDDAQPQPPLQQQHSPPTSFVSIANNGAPIRDNEVTNPTIRPIPSRFPVGKQLSEDSGSNEDHRSSDFDAEEGRQPSAGEDQESDTARDIDFARAKRVPHEEGESDEDDE